MKMKLVAFESPALVGVVVGGWEEPPPLNSLQTVPQGHRLSAQFTRLPRRDRHAQKWTRGNVSHIKNWHLGWQPRSLG